MSTLHKVSMPVTLQDGLNRRATIPVVLSATGASNDREAKSQRRFHDPVAVLGDCPSDGQLSMKRVRLSMIVLFSLMPPWRT
jgi:hypothetical protein